MSLRLVNKAFFLQKTIEFTGRVQKRKTLKKSLKILGGFVSFRVHLIRC